MINKDSTEKGDHAEIFLDRDGISLADAGLSQDSVISPSYDSSKYIEPIVDWDFYGGACPDGGAAAVRISETCDAMRSGAEHAHRGVASFFQGLAGGGSLCGPPAGAGIAVEQDPATLRFRVAHLAPAGPADHSGRVRVGDVIAAVDRRPCADAAGLEPAQAAEVRRLCESRGDGGGGWLAGALDGGDSDGRAIGDCEGLRRALSGPEGSWVAVTLRRGAAEETAQLQRRRLRHFAGDYL